MDKHKTILNIMRQQTAERLASPEKLRDWIRQIHGEEMRELKGDEAEQMLVVLKLIGHYADTNNQRTHTYFYNHNNKEYRVTYGLGNNPLVEEVHRYDL